MAIPKFPGFIKNGAPVLDNTAKFRAYLSSFKNGARIELILRKLSKKRTNPQNRYYWGVVVPMLGKHFGYTKSEMHEALKWQFLRKPEADPPTVGSTRKLTTEQFNEYIETIQIWSASEYSVVIPDPNEAMTEDELID
jgi:hypothetical protein